MTAPLLFPKLHLYGQSHNHDEAVLVGNREALESLRTAIDAALSANPIQAMEAFASDGEGFDAFVILVDGPQLDRLPLPYHDFELFPVSRDDLMAWEEYRMGMSGAIKAVREKRFSEENNRAG